MFWQRVAGWNQHKHHTAPFFVLPLLPPLAMQLYRGINTNLAIVCGYRRQDKNKRGCFGSTKQITILLLPRLSLQQEHAPPHKKVLQASQSVFGETFADAAYFFKCICVESLFQQPTQGYRNASCVSGCGYSFGFFFRCFAIWISITPNYEGTQ